MRHTATIVFILVFLSGTSTRLHATVTVTGPRVLCEGTTATLSAPAGLRSYRWNTGDATQSITVSAPGIYRVDVVDNSGISDFGTYDLQASFTPRIRIGNPLEYLCNGDEARLEAPPIYAVYRWSTGDSTNAIRVTEEGVYSLTVVDTNGCTGTSDAVRVIVVDRPSIDITGVNAACRNAEATYTVPVRAGTTYEWFINGGTVLIGANTAAVRVQWSRTGMITVRATQIRPDGGTCDTSVSLPVVVGARLRPELYYDRSSLCVGDSIKLRASDGFASYRWSTGATTSSITVTTGGAYWIEVTDSTGCSGSSDTLTVISYPRPAISIVGDTAMCQGASTTLTGSSPINDIVVWDWSTGERTPQITVTTPGTYTLIGWTLSGCTDTSTVTVLSGQPINVMITNQNFLRVKVGTTINGAITIANRGSVALDITSIEFTEPSVTLYETIPTTIPVNTPAVIGVRWMPTVVGPMSTTVRVVVRTPTCLDTLEVYVTGVAYDAPPEGSLDISIPDTVVNISDKLLMPITVSLNVSTMQFGSLFFDITYDRRSMILQNVLGAAIVSEQYTGEQSTVTLYIENMPGRADTIVWLDVVGLLQPSRSATITPDNAKVGTTTPVTPMYDPGTISYTGCWLPGRMVTISDDHHTFVRRRFDVTGRELDQFAPCQPCFDVLFDPNGRIIATYLMNSISR